MTRKLVESTFVTPDGVGTGELNRTLLAHELVDEFHFWIVPALAGGGQRLIDGVDTMRLALVGTTTVASGIVVHTYAPR